MTAVMEKERIDVREYCDTVHKELTEMKAKVYNVICATEKVRGETEPFSGRYAELFELVDYIEKKLGTLTKECPLDWAASKEEIESGKKKLEGAINWWDEEHIAGGYVGG